jgi:hypothetical protein
MFEQYNPSEQNSAQEDNLQLQSQAKSGANWFYWIAGASVVNTIIFLFDGNLNFMLGLGIVQVINGFAILVEGQTDATTAPKVGAFLVNLAISAIFLIIGYFAGKGLSWIFITGIILYVLDGVIFLLFGDWLSIGLHAFALFFIVRGLMALNKLNKLSPPANAL